MRLVIFSHFFGPSAGGAEMQVLTLASGIVKQSGVAGAPPFEVTVVSGVSDQDARESNYPFQVIRRPGVYQVWKLIRRASVVHLAGPILTPLWMAALQRKTTVIEHHGYQSICPNGLLIHHPERSVCPGYFQAKRYVECVKCQAREMSFARSILNMLLMIPRYLLSKTVAANVAITDHVLRRHALPSSERIYYGTEDLFAATFPAIPAAEKVCLAFVGRFVPEKGIPVLLEAAAILKNEGLDFTVRLIGDGPQRAELEEIIDKMALKHHVSITGYVSGAAMKEALRDVSVVVVPSVWEEAAGLVAIEQMMEGRVVIASAIGGLKEVVSDGGFLFPAGDASALAALIGKVLRSGELMRSASKRARARALQLFQIDRMVSDHIRLYLRLAQSSGN